MTEHKIGVADVVLALMIISRNSISGAQKQQRQNQSGKEESDIKTTNKQKQKLKGKS